MTRRGLGAAMLVVGFVGPLFADDGFPSFNRRIYVVEDVALFEGAEKYPDYVFYLSPNAKRIAASAGPLQVLPGATVLAVPKNLPGGTERYSPEWYRDPKVLHSEPLIGGPRKMAASGPPTVQTTYRIDIHDGKVVLTQLDQTVAFGETDSSAAVVVGLVCGGIILGGVIVVVGLIYYIRRTTKPLAAQAPSRNGA